MTPKEVFKILPKKQWHKWRFESNRQGAPVGAQNRGDDGVWVKGRMER